MEKKFSFAGNGGMLSCVVWSGVYGDRREISWKTSGTIPFIHAITVFREMFLQTFWTDGMAELSLGILCNIGLDLIPISFIISDFLTVGTNGDDASQGLYSLLICGNGNLNQHNYDACNNNAQNKVKEEGRENPPERFLLRLFDNQIPAEFFDITNIGVNYLPISRRGKRTKQKRGEGLWQLVRNVH